MSMVDECEWPESQRKGPVSLCVAEYRMGDIEPGSTGLDPNLEVVPVSLARGLEARYEELEKELFTKKGMLRRLDEDYVTQGTELLLAKRRVKAAEALAEAVGSSPQHGENPCPCGRCAPITAALAAFRATEEGKSE